jgi:ankyrin repeat protein
MRVCYDGGMKNILPILAMLWAFSTPLAAQNTPPNVTLEKAFLEMAFNGNLAAVQQFVSKGTPVNSTIDDKSTALMWAAFNGHTAVAAYLLERGATVDLKDINGRTALLYASSGPYPATVGLLLRNGADVNVQGKAEGFTALMMAASEGLLEVARVLLFNGAAVDIIDRDGDTAKKFAREKGHTAMLELLESQPVKRSTP